MAVDIKTLRIGSHVLMDGVRAKVMRLNTVKYSETETFHILVRGISPDTGAVGECGCFADDNAVQPIPITPDLLKELGFEERRREHLYGSPDVWYIDREAAQLEKENNLVVPTIHVSSLGKAGYPDWWVIKVVTGDKPMRSDNCTVRYLHEAETFLALHGIGLKRK